MPHERQWVIDTLRRLGLSEAADEAEKVLPDPVTREELQQFGDRYGISLDQLTDRMGGSP